MTERTYTLAEITDVLGQALKRVNRHDLLTFERPFNLFLDDVVRLLKEPPAEPQKYPFTEVGVDNRGRFYRSVDGGPREYGDFASPND